MAPKPWLHCSSLPQCRCRLFVQAFPFRHASTVTATLHHGHGGFAPVLVRPLAVPSRRCEHCTYLAGCHHDCHGSSYLALPHDHAWRSFAVQIKFWRNKTSHENWKGRETDELWQHQAKTKVSDGGISAKSTTTWKQLLHAKTMFQQRARPSLLQVQLHVFLLQSELQLSRLSLRSIFLKYCHRRNFRTHKNFDLSRSQTFVRYKFLYNEGGVTHCYACMIFIWF